MVQKVQDSNEEYHSSPLIGTSVMVSGYDSKTGKVNLAKVKAQIDGLNSISKSTQKIFDLGTIQHSAILEQDMSEIKVMPVFSPIPAKTAKAQKEEWELKFGSDGEVPDFKPIKAITKKAQEDSYKASHPAKFYIKEEEYKNVEGAFEVVASNDTASRLISNATDVETSFYDTDEGIRCKPDIVGETDKGSLFICNYKTINDLSKVNSHSFHLKYDIRAMQEVEIVQKHYKKNVDHYFFLFQEKTAPYTLRLIEISSIDREIAWEEYKKIKNTVLTAVKNDYFPQPPLVLEESKIYRTVQQEDF